MKQQHPPVWWGTTVYSLQGCAAITKVCSWPLVSVKEVINSFRVICMVFCYSQADCWQHLLKMNIFCLVCLVFCTKVNLRWRREETFSLGTFGSDICLTFQTCHNSATDKIIGTLINITNNWDLQSDLLCSARPVRERTAPNICMCILWWALKIRQHLSKAK